MQIASIIGWVILGIGVAAAICTCTKPATCADGTKDDISECDAEKSSAWDSAWCEAMERAGDCAVLFLDQALRLVASGARGAAMTDNAPSGRHLIDIVPGEIAPLFLNGVSVARRGEKKTWRCKWDGVQILATAALVMDRGIALVIKEDGE